MLASTARLSIALVAIVIASACGSSEGELSLGGKVFVAAEAVGEITMPAKVKLNFTDSNLGINAGCNNGGGDYKVKDGVLIIGTMAQTDMYCEGLMEQEQAVFGLISESPNITLIGDTLTLVGEDLTLTLQLASGD